MELFIKLNCVLILFVNLFSDAIEVNVGNVLYNTNSASHVRSKRYDYPKPPGWEYASSSLSQEYSYGNSHHQANTNGYRYDKPSTYFIQDDNLRFGGQLGERDYDSLINDPRFVDTGVQMKLNNYFNHDLNSRVPDRNDPMIHTPLQPNLSYQRSSLSSNGERDSSRTMGDDQGAFIDSDIFGGDFDDSNFTISPTGLLLIKPSGGSAFGGGGKISCDEPYQRPPVPDFRAAGRRVSEVKCYEYVWELRQRSNLEQRNKQCNNTRSKRSGNWLESNYQQNWFQGYWYSPAGTQPVVDSPHIWSNQPLRWYNRTDQANTETTTPTSGLGGSSFGIGFENVEPEEFPHMAALGWRGVNEEYVFKCGGSLISRNFVLTAAHCTASAPDPFISDLVPRIVRIGDTNIGFRPNGQTFNQKRRSRQARNPGRFDVGIMEIIKHEQYDPNMKYFDIALLKLEYDLDFNKHLQPACLWTDPNSSNRIKKAVAAGWGIVNLATGRTTLDLQAGELDIIDTDTCNRLLLPSFGRKFRQVIDHQICAGKLSGGSDVCQGDSGGPLQVKIQLPIKDQGSMHTILGIISAGVGCAKPDTPGVYTRVSSFVDWIENYVWN